MLADANLDVIKNKHVNSTSKGILTEKRREEERRSGQPVNYLYITHIVH